MSESFTERLQEAIRGESLDGWLFWNFRHRDKLADEILGLDAGATNTRPWLYAVPAAGRPHKVVHAIEAGLLDALEGDRTVYTGQAAWRAALAAFSGKRWGVHLSSDLPIISFLDAGAADEFRAAGLELVPAAGLVQRLKGRLGPEAIADHERSAAALYAVVAAAWEGVSAAYAAGSRPTEGAVRRGLLAGLAERGLATDHPPIVAAGAASGDPHYDFAGEGRTFAPGDVVQIDIWAKAARPGSIYADISWVGVFGPRPPAPAAQAFAALAAARDGAVAHIADRLVSGERPTGAEVDARVRAALIGAGYGDALRHRTGHAIDTECHGSGANLDSVEFPDSRRLIDGACFSIEPGLYFPDFGLRTEIDAYVQDGRIVVSGGPIQRDFLTCGGER
jgi:Xaa-Pro aminopeptidase